MRLCVLGLWLSALLVLGPVPGLGQATESGIMFIQGTIDRETKAVELQVISEPERNVALPPIPPGPFLLRLENELGETLAEIPFQLSRVYDLPDDQPDSFLLVVPFDPKVRRLAILEAGRKLHELIASPHPPTVRILSPNGGEVLQEGDQLTWQASDPDGDPVSFIIQFSADDGVTWKVESIGVSDQAYDISLEYKPRTEKGRYRVIASDGFNSAADVSDGPVTIANRPPRLAIRSPGHDNTYVANQLVFFDARARDDSLDGEMPGDAILWRSSLDGFLGRGDHLEILATELSEGVHVIEAEADDGEGGQSRQRVAVRINRVAMEQGGIAVIDVLPGDDENLVDLTTERRLPVAVLTTSRAAGDPVDLDAAEIDPESLSLHRGRTGSGAGAAAQLVDVNGDGRPDLLTEILLAARAPGDTFSMIVLEAETWDGQPLIGTDWLRLATDQRKKSPNLRFPLRVTWDYDNRERLRSGTLIESTFGVALTNTGEAPLFEVTLRALAMGGTPVARLALPNRLSPTLFELGDLAPHETAEVAHIDFAFDYATQEPGVFWRLSYRTAQGDPQEVVFRQ